MDVKFLFKINKEKWNAFIKLRGWQYPQGELAKRTGFSKSYISQAINGSIPLSHEFMLSYINVTGNAIDNPAEWASLFHIHKKHERPKSITKDNYSKYRGEKDYVKYSEQGKIRKKDKAKDLKRLDAKEPVPAVDYYYDATPKKIQYQRQYGGRKYPVGWPK